MQNWKERYEAKLTKPWMKKYFSYRGRLNRKPYILRSLVLALVLNIILPLGLGMLTFALPSGEIVFNIFSAVLGLVYSVASFSLVARRLHDIDNGAERVSLHSASASGSGYSSSDLSVCCCLSCRSPSSVHSWEGSSPSCSVSAASSASTFSLSTSASFSEKAQPARIVSAKTRFSMWESRLIPNP